VSWPAWKNAERAADAARRDAALAARILADKEVLGALSAREQQIVARRYLDKTASWAELADAMQLTKHQVTGTWRRMCARLETEV
jgi:DNA-directed RNA polymerase sigma subunit (sigma70/sigma32)